MQRAYAPRKSAARTAAHASLDPDAETMAGEWTLSGSPEIQRLRDRLWTRIKAA